MYKTAVIKNGVNDIWLAALTLMPIEMQSVFPKGRRSASSLGCGAAPLDASALKIVHLESNFPEGHLTQFRGLGL